MGIIKLPFKLIALLLCGVVKTVSAFAHIAKGLSGFFIGFIMFVLFCMCVYFALNGKWDKVIDTFFSGVGWMIFKLASELICSLSDGLYERLMSFINS